MKKALFGFLAIMLVFAPYVGAADWMPIVQTDATEWFYALGATKNPDGTSKQWIKKVYTEKGRARYIELRTKNGLSIEGYENLRESIERWEMNCKTKQYKLISLSDYALDGTVIVSHAYDSKSVEWDDIIPDSIGETIFQALCGQAKRRQ